jgi:hypothetical protein
MTQSKLYLVGEFSSHWHDGEQPMKITSVYGMDKLMKLISEHDLLHESNEEMYSGVELRIIRTKAFPNHFRTR